MPTAPDPDALLRQVVAILERERQEQGLTQAELGNRSGIAQSTVSKYMGVRLRLNISQLDAMCHALSLRPGSVVAEADEMRNA